MKGIKPRKAGVRFLLVTAVLLMIVGMVMLAQTFTHYNSILLTRQDAQLQEMAKAADESIAQQLNNINQDLIYVLNRRGFVEAEDKWASGGNEEDLLFRMQENLVAQNPLIRTILLVQDGEILLSSDGSTDYYFPDSGEGHLLPCIAGDGTLYLALTAETEHAVYAAAVDVAAWYAALTQAHTGAQTRLMLLGHRGRILMHQWMGSEYVASVEELTEENCDKQAVQHMMECRTTGNAQTATYSLSYPGDTFVHEMRMAVIPVDECVNGYFIVGMTSDYDEIIRPMHAAALRMIVFSGMVVLGILLIAALALMLIQQNRHRDQELHRLQLKNAQAQQLLEKTQELAHHQRLETIGTLTASIAHEFNNLLTPIMGYSILTLEGLPEDADDLADNVTEIYEASRKAKTILSRLNDMSRKNATATFTTLSLEQLVQKALVVAAPAKPANVETLVCCDQDGYVHGNETQLTQLLLNLILNAFHAMAERGGTVTMRIDQHEGRARLRVIDTGVGIPDDALPHIFEPFYTTKKSGHGTGLGLAIVQQVVESHGGSITAESTVGVGTVFTLLLPLSEIAAES